MANIDKDTGELIALDFDEFHENLPDAMLQAKRWLLWEERPNPDSLKKPLKVPYYSAGTPRGETDTSEDASRLVSFSDAFNAYIDNLGKYTGLGFALGNDGTGNHWQGIDFDGISQHENLSALKDILPGYVEISPNGDGVHCIGYGRKFEAIGPNKEDGIEAYSTGRYFTVTANALQNGALHDLNSFIEKHLHPITNARSRSKKEHESYECYDLTPSQIKHVRSALTIFNSEDRVTWVEFGHALKKHGNVGRSLWIEWSQQSDLYDPKDANDKWNGFAVDTRNEIDYRHIIKAAQNAGWLNPNASVDDIEEWAILDEPISEHFFASGPKPIEYVVDGFNATGITMIAGASGVGKTSVLAPLAAFVAGLWSVPNMQISLRRHIVYVTEDPCQIHRILTGLIESENLSEYIADFDQWFHVITADRRTMERLKFSINNWRKKYSYTASEQFNNYIVEPLIILDTTNATIDLDNENDNSEVGKYISTIKQSIGSGSCWLVAHLTKLTASSNKLDDLSPRGAGAFVGDSNATAFLVKDKKNPDKRYMLLGKRRFEAAFNMLEFNSITSSIDVDTPWGQQQKIIYRYGVPKPSDSEAYAEAEKAEQEQEKQQKEDVDISVLCVQIMSYVHQVGGVDVPWSEIKLAIGGKTERLVAAKDLLLAEEKLVEHRSGDHRSAAKFYSIK